MTGAELAAIYRGYIDCLNERDWDRLGLYVHEDACHNGRPLGLAGYRAMLEADYRAIPDLRFEIALLVCEPPRGQFLGLDVDGRRVEFTENVFYAFEGRKIRTVWSILDKAAIEAVLRTA